MFYAYISDLINSIDKEEISYKNLHSMLNISNNGEVIKVPYKSVIKEYLPFLEKSAIVGQLTDSDISKYRYKPKSLSYDLYGTTELWSAILELNGMESIIDFYDIANIKLFEPKSFMKLLNEVMVLEGILK